jgi:dTMP kinase
VDQNQPGVGFGMYQGVFITFEGCEGSGKTTQAQKLKEYLEGRGKEVVLVREPGGTPVGEKIREMLLGSDESIEIAPITEALLFAADRAQQVMDVIRPALDTGAVVIGDRYTDSSLAYQGVARGCGLEAVKNLNEWATDGLEPNLTLFLDLPVATGLARAGGTDADRIESEKIEFHENVRSAYSMLLKIFSYRYAVIDARGTEIEVHSRILGQVEKTIS